MAVMLGLATEHDWNLDAALEEANTLRAQNLRRDFDLLSEKDACQITVHYRAISVKERDIVPRAADVDMALFGLSLRVRPMNS